MFKNREEAGLQLASLLKDYEGLKEGLVLGLARGGVVVGHSVAKALHLPLNVLAPRKIGAPGNHELAIGAILETGETVWNTSILKMLNLPEAYLKMESDKEKVIALQRSTLYRQEKPFPSCKDKVVFLVDDGMATGATMQAAIQAMKNKGAKKVIVAIPVASSSAVQKIKPLADEVACLYQTDDFGAVGYFYKDFGEVTDDEVIALL